MKELTYYFFNLAVFLPVLILSFVTDVKPHRHLRGLLAGVLFVSFPFIVWDIWAVAAGHWDFNSAFVTGPFIFGLPLEEILFFITVPFAMMYVWGVVKKFVADRNIALIVPLLGFGLGLAASIWMLVYYWGNGYTRSAAIAAIIAILFAMFSRIGYSARFWTFQLLLLALLLIFNSYLTSLPVITYGADAIIGFRVGTIPIEDFFFGFAFINLFLLAFHAADQPRLTR